MEIKVNLFFFPSPFIALLHTFVQLLRKQTCSELHIVQHAFHSVFLFLSLSEQTKVVVIQGDITDYSSVLEACRGADVVVHTASLVDVWHRVPETLIYSVNVTG